MKKASANKASANKVSANKASASKASANIVANSTVEGTVNGTSVTMAHADFDGQLAIYEGDGWGFSPSLLIFLFLDNNESPAGQTFVVRRGENGMHPHVHYRWRGDSGDIDTEVVSSDYEMTLVFGEADGEQIPGTIEFSVPDEDTHVQGQFLASLK